MDETLCFYTEMGDEDYQLDGFEGDCWDDEGAYNDGEDSSDNDDE